MPPVSERDAQQGAKQGRGAPALACGWYETLETPPPPKIARGALRFDKVVVGAGFTGLACARRLAELFPAASIALIEAERVGAANSGRNSGFLLDVFFYGKVPPAIQAARTRLQRGGLQELTRVVAKHGIDCDWQPWGNLHGAITEEEERALSALAQQYRDDGQALEDWSAARMAEVTGSKTFRRGVFHPGSVLVQPVKLIRGLAASLPDSVTLFENSPVAAVTRRGNAIELRTAESSISTERLFLCANGGTPDLGHGRNRLLKVSTFAAMTPPLDAASGPIKEAEAFGFLPCFAGGATLRKTKDNRLLVRQGTAFTPRGYPNAKDYERFADQARNTMSLRWPELARTPFAFVWSGVMSLTRNSGQIFGQLAPNLYVAAFCNGAGNTSGTMAGRLLAELSAGNASDLLADQISLPRPSWLPPEAVCAFLVKRRIARAKRRHDRVYAASVRAAAAPT